MSVKICIENCVLCGNPMVRCLHHHQIVWFCRHCWQEMPDLAMQHFDALPRARSLEPEFQVQTGRNC